MRREIVLLAAALSIGCGDPGESPGGAGENPPAGETGPIFVDVTEQVGLEFVHDNGMAGSWYLPEIMGAGAGLFDADGDGDLDAYLVQGGPIGEGPGAGPAPGDRFYRNELVETGTLRFTDVTDASGLRSAGYGMGVAAGDVDNDGDVDLYVANFGANALFRNAGDGTFEDVTALAGVGDPRWSTSASFVDLDGDGWLDLYVCNYVDFRIANNKACAGASGALDYCSPEAYPPLADRLYRNRGDGIFEDVSLRAGIGKVRGSGLGVVTADLDGDGRTDLYVANDRMANNLWINRGDFTFEDRALMAGVAVNAAGMAEASMGLAAQDFDGDGDDDLFLTHLRLETNTLYRQDGRGMFSDRTARSGLGSPSLRLTGFGTAWLDWNADGRLDLFVANGAVTILEALAAEGDPYPFSERNQLFVNTGDGRFEEADGGDDLALEEVSRGTAFGDVDNDGDEDLLVSNNRGPTRLLLREGSPGGGWIGLHLVAGDPPVNVLGARVAVTTADGRVLWRRTATDGSYGSAVDPRLVVGLGQDRRVAEIRVVWPDGLEEIFPGAGAGAWNTLARGAGVPAGG